MAEASTFKKLPVTVLSGFLGAGKTTLLRRILQNRGGLRVCLIVNDMSELNVDAALVRSGEASLSRTTEKMVEMQNGCICCTLREDLLEEVARLAKEGRYDYLVIESTGVSEPMPVAETFTFDVPGHATLSEIATLDTMVTVVDCFNFGKDIRSGALLLSERRVTVAPADGAPPAADGSVRVPVEITEAPEDARDDRTVIQLLVDQIEFCNVAILNKIELCTPEEVALVVGTVRKLNPDCKIYQTSYSEVPLDAVLNTGLFSFERALLNTGWLKEARGSHVPETLEYGINSFVYRRRRPLHPKRLFDALDDTFNGIIRSKGWVWLATHPTMSGEWAQAGEVFSLTPSGPWLAAMPEEDWPEFDSPETEAAFRRDFDPDPRIGDRRVEIVFIGIAADYSQAKIEAVLDACMLTDEELAMGEDRWIAEFDDPFRESWDLALMEQNGEGEDEGEDDGDGEVVAMDE